MNQQPVVIVRTGTANVASVAAACRRLGCVPTVTDDRDAVESARLLVLPGVGAFGAIMDAIDVAGLREILAARVRAGRPTLGICLGFQALFRESDETPGVRGLGVFDAPVRRFTGGAELRVPQMGWNRVEVPADSAVLRTGSAYFANTFRVGASDWPSANGWRAARSEHGEGFVAAIEGHGGRVVACQCHPELSGAWGLGLIRRWVACAAEGVSPC